MNLEPCQLSDISIPVPVPVPLLLLKCQTVVFVAWQTEFSVCASQMGLIETSSLGFMLANDYSLSPVLSLFLHSLLI